MNKSILTIILSCFAILSFGQRSLNMTLKSDYIPPNVTPNNGNQFNDIWGYAADGREYAIMGSFMGTHFIDVTDPNTPVQVDFVSGANTSPGSTWRDFKTYGHYAYGVGDVTGHTLQIFDLQYLPDSVVKVYDDDEFTSNSHNIHVNNDRLYLISNTRGGSYYPLDILCIEDPTNPVLIGGIRNNVNVTGSYSTSHDAFVKNDTVFLSCYSGSNNGLHAFDFVDPENPVLLGSITNYPGAGINHATWLNDDGTHLIMADETLNSPLKMVSVSDLTNMQAVSTFEAFPGSIAHNPFIKDCMAYISYYHEGVQIYDISDPTTPVRAGYFHTDTTIGQGNYSPNYEGVWGIYPYLPSGNIIASDRKLGLFVLTYDGAFPNCSGDFEEVVEMDTTKYCYDTTTVPVAINRINSVEEVSVYPNPSQGEFNVRANYNSPTKLIVYSLDGKEVLAIENNENQFEFNLNLSEEKTGMYILEIQYPNSKDRIKIFKQ